MGTTLYKNNKKEPKKPILVTGSHCSGTTWVGKMLALEPTVGYIHEPFNLEMGRGICTANFNHWFEYITKENEKNYKQALAKTLGFKYNFPAALRTAKTLKQLGLQVKYYNKFPLNRLLKKNPLVKDPIAFFSSEWLAETFDMNVIVMIRHPAAFANSLKQREWTFNFSNLLKQPLLMRNHLKPFEPEMRELSEKEFTNIIDQASLLWKIIYSTARKFEKKHSDWLFVRHENLARNPINGFREIFNKLNLKYSKKIEDHIKKYSSPENQTATPKEKTKIMRNSRALIWNWKQELIKKEIEKIKRQVKDISKIYYTEKDW